MRYVEFSPRAEQARTDLPAPARSLVNAAIRRILEAPEWGAGSDRPEIRLLNPGHGANSGLIAVLVPYRRRVYAIVYRIRRTEDLVAIEDIREVFVG